MKDDNILLTILGLILLIGCIFEITLLGIAFFGADKVECNLLWCTFTTERDFSTKITNQTVVIETHSTCFVNGYEVDCNKTQDLERIVTSGNFDKKPIFKYDDDWKDIYELAENK